MSEKIIQKLKKNGWSITVENEAFDTNINDYLCYCEDGLIRIMSLFREADDSYSFESTDKNIYYGCCSEKVIAWKAIED